MRRKAFALFFALLFACCCFSVSASAAYTPEFDIHAQAVCLIKADTGAVIFEKNAEERMYPASLTALMTAVVAMEQVDINTAEATYQLYMQDLLYNQKMAGVSVSLGGILLKETFCIRDLLYAVFLQSANDAALMIADGVAGSQDAFVAMMNEKAAQLGLSGTHYANATGLYDPEHYTTAQDVVKLAQYALSLPGFEQFITATRYTVKQTNKQTDLTWTSNNYMMMPSSSYYYEPLKGIKAAALDEAGRCFVSTASKDGFTYLLAVMKAPIKDGAGNYYSDNYAFFDTKALYSWVFDTFKVKTVVETGKNITEIPVKLAWGKDSTRLMSKDRFSALMPVDIDVSNVQIIPVLDDYLTAPVSRGTEVGYAKLVLAGEELGQITLVAAENIERSQLLYLLDFVKSIFSSFLFKFIFVLLILLVLFYVVLMILRNRNRRRYRSNQRKIRR